MKSNSVSCIKNGYLAYGIPCVEFAIGSKAKNRIRTDKLTAVDPRDMDIKPVNAKHFFQMAQKRDQKKYIWISRVLSTDCTSKECSNSSHVAKWCVNTTKKVAQKNYSKFMKTKPEYTRENLLKQVSSEYHSIIEIFIKSNADKAAKHRAKWNHEIHLEEGKKTPFVRNYKPLSDQKTAAVKKYIDEHLRKGFIRPSSFAVASTILLVQKPGGGLYFCIDYRALNAVTVKNRYPIPLILETLEKLTGAVKYTKLDIIHAFN